MFFGWLGHRDIKDIDHRQELSLPKREIVMICYDIGIYWARPVQSFQPLPENDQKHEV